MEKILVTFRKDDKFYDEVFVNATDKEELDLKIKNHLDKYHKGVDLSICYMALLQNNSKKFRR